MLIALATPLQQEHTLPRLGEIKILSETASRFFDVRTGLVEGKRKTIELVRDRFRLPPHVRNYRRVLSIPIEHTSSPKQERHGFLVNHLSQIERTDLADHLFACREKKPPTGRQKLVDRCEILQIIQDQQPVG